MRQLMDPGYGMFTFNSRGLYWFAPLYLPELEPEFELVGTLLGLALFNSNVLEFAFPKLIFRCGRDRLLASICYCLSETGCQGPAASNISGWMLKLGTCPGAGRIAISCAHCAIKCDQPSGFENSRWPQSCSAA